MKKIETLVLDEGCRTVFDGGIVVLLQKSGWPRPARGACCCKESKSDTTRSGPGGGRQEEGPTRQRFVSALLARSAGPVGPLPQRHPDGSVPPVPDPRLPCVDAPLVDQLVAGQA